MELVVGASEATMKSLLSKLGGLLAHEYSLIRGVRGDIQYINDEMASMQAFLGDLSAASAAPRGHDRRMKDWMKQIRDVTYDIEDCVDDFAHRLSHDPTAGSGGEICCAFLVSGAYEIWTWRPRRDIAAAVAELKARAQQIGERRARYGVENPRSGDGDGESGGGAVTGFDAAENQQTSLELVGTKKPVGVDKEMDELGKWVTLQQQQQQQVLPAASSSQLDPPSDPASQAEAAKRHDHGVLSIVGFGGVGKTTIATALYQRFGDQFERRAMVTVSQSSDIEAILRIILAQVMPQSKDSDGQQGGSGGGASEKNRLLAAIGTIWATDEGTSERTQGNIQTMKLERLKEELEKHLKKYSYLLLVDDVWSATTWEQTKKSLPRSERGSRVIVTTRFQAVASTCKRDKGDYVHKVVVLSGDKPKELFMEVMAESKFNKEDEEKQKKIPSEVMPESKFNKEDEEKQKKILSEVMDKSKLNKEDEEKQKKIPSEVMAKSKLNKEDEEKQKKIPSRIWEMCGGLPLAIVTMAGLVACNPHRSEEEWNKVCNALVPATVKSLAQDGVTRILSHCYNDMPGEIKTCSLYLSIFPKSRKISRKRLTRRWIAEAFVSEKQGLSVEDVAETYFNHLIRRKIIRAVEHSSNGKVKSYQVHDMVLEYIVSKASEENFVTVVGGHWLMAPPSSKVRRLSLQGSDSKHGSATENMNLSHVRSLTMFGSLNQLPSNSLKFGIVQVLDLEGCKDFKQHHTKEICKMLLLKYLSLRRTDIKSLPRKIGNLQYLETLDIRETNITELSKSVCQLERLINILGGNKRTRKALKLPEELKKKTMKALRILSGIEIVEGPTTVADLHHLTDLRKLAIYKLNIKKGDKIFEDLSSSIEYLGGYSLHTLIINDESSEFLKSLGALSSPPKFLNALELSGKLFELPEWITDLDALTKLTLSVTALTADALGRLSKLKMLFSLTFSLTAAKQDPETIAIIEENKEHSHGEIIVPAGGFENLKLLRFSVPFVPLLSFPEKAMPKLERLELRFSILEGIYGLENLAELKEVHLRVHDEAGEVTKLLVDDMATAAREDDKGPRIIVDQYHG